MPFIPPGGGGGTAESEVRALGRWEAETNTVTATGESLVNGVGVRGDFYINVSDGVHDVDFGSGLITFEQNQVVQYNGNVWENLNFANTAKSVGVAPIRSISDAINAQEALQLQANKDSALKVAGHALTAGDAVYLGADGKVYKSDKNDETKANTIGIALESKGSGQSVSIQLAGSIAQIDAWSFNAGSQLYLGSSGAIIETQPAQNEFLTVIGRAIDTDKVFLSFAHLGKQQ